MSSGVFRGKESSNRIKISRLVQDIEFWCFGLPVALGRWQVSGGCLGTWGCVLTHMHMNMHAHTCIYV